MQAPILYSFRRCPYAMRARMALIRAGIECEVREIKLSAKPEAMLRASPKGTVPVLVLPDGQVLEESLDIMAHVLSINDPDNWLIDAQAASSLITRNDTDFKHHLDRYKYPERHQSDATAHFEAGLEILNDYEARLADNNFLSGPSARLVDVAVFPFVRQFAAVDPDRFASQELGNLARWLQVWLESDLFKAAMVRFPVWEGGQPPQRLGG